MLWNQGHARGNWVLKVVNRTPDVPRPPRCAKGGASGGVVQGAGRRSCAEDPHSPVVIVTVLPLSLPLSPADRRQRWLLPKPLDS